MDSATDTSGLMARLTWTGYSLAYVLLFAATVPLFVLTVVGISTAVLGVGIVLCVIAVPLTALVAGTHRRMAGRLLGTPIPSPYQRPEAPGLLAQLRCWVNDKARWRDLLWLLVAMTAGYTLAWLVLGFFLAVIWYSFFPVLWAITPDGVFDMNYGIFTIDTQPEAFFEWVWAGLAFALWWWLAPVLGRTLARLDRALLSPDRTEHLQQRVRTLAESRADTVDASAAELRRVERDLHDGAQARLVALGMSLGMAEEILDGDPEAAKQWLREARTTTTSALADLRTVVRGIHPPVLADRGLTGAVQALALDMPIPVVVTVAMTGRPPAPVESATYFAIAEALTNIVRHSGASRARVEISHDGAALRVVVGDDGRGGASLAGGTGLAGVARRLGAFDGTITVTSPPGGPTVVAMEVPCALSSPRTSPSFGTA